MSWFNMRLTTAFGITTMVHWSVPLMILVLSIFSPNMAILMSVCFLSIIPHEYGHALAARYYKIPTKSITLYPVGGVAALELTSETADKLRGWSEVVVAIAGPLVTLALAAGAFVIFLLHSYWQHLTNPEGASVATQFWLTACLLNVALLVFNMLPAFPMDGGRVFRGLLSMFMTHVKATTIAYYTSVGLCVIVGVAGIFLGSIMLPAVMMLIALMGNAELQQVKKAQEKLEKKHYIDNVR